VWFELGREGRGSAGDADLVVGHWERTSQSQMTDSKMKFSLKGILNKYIYRT
jgi:hypothetical protein